MNSSKNHDPEDLLHCGIDEAGRGPVLGPMVLCGVCLPESELDFFVKIGARDSKKLSAKKRKELAKIIKKNCFSYKTIVVTPEKIDGRESKHITLNRLEELEMAKIVNALKPSVIYLDAADVNEARFGESIKKLLDYKPKDVISKHRADDTYPIVSAASIIAKDMRDAIIEELKEKYGDFGSGYPSDERTTDFLRKYIRKHKKPPPIARKTWSTTIRILEEEVKNKKITDFF